MKWRKYLLLSYAETHNFSLRRSIVGIVLIVVVCLVAGIIRMTVDGKLQTCSAVYQPAFAEAQVTEGGEGCVGDTVSVGEMVSKPSFTYVVGTQIEEYRNETLRCEIQKKSATINVLSFAAPQFVWGYQISCSRPSYCCPEKTETPSTSCFCDQKLMLRIGDFSVDYAGSQLLTASTSTASTSTANYSGLNNTVSSITVQACPTDGERIMVLRFDDTSYDAFSSSKSCIGNSSAQNSNIASALAQIRDSIDSSIDYDLTNFRLDGRNYLCYSCSRTRDTGQLLLDLVIAISAIGSLAYSIILWLLEITQRGNASTPTLGMPQRLAI